jgi:hypothetical protein
MRGLTRAAGTAAIAVATLAFAPAAGAKVQNAGGISYASKKISVPAAQTPAGAFRRYVAKCPKGTRVIGGGERNDSAFDQVRMAQSYPVDDGDPNSAPDDGWGVLLQNVADVKHTGKAYAVCAAVKPTYISAGFMIAASSQDDNEVDCPAGRHIAAGGTRGHKLLFQNSLFPFPETVGFYMDNFDSAPHPVTGTAICLKSPTQVLATDQATLDGPERKRLKLTCPAGKHVLSGGQDNSAAFDFYAQSSFPSAQGGGAPDDFWNLTLELLGAGSRTARGYAVCTRAL